MGLSAEKCCKIFISGFFFNEWNTEMLVRMIVSAVGSDTGGRNR